MFDQLLIKIFLYIQTFFYLIYNKLFIFDNLIIYDYDIKKTYKYKFLFMLYYHLGFLFDINKTNNNKWICYLYINEKLYIYVISDYKINVFNYLLNKYNNKNNNDNSISNILLFKMNGNIINISKYPNYTEIYKIIIFENIINNYSIKDDDIIISYLSMKNMKTIEIKYNDIKDNIINTL